VGEGLGKVVEVISHTPEIKPGVFVAGSVSKAPEYSKGPTSWKTGQVAVADRSRAEQNIARPGREQER
jgi:hypothetical protein